MNKLKIGYFADGPWSHRAFDRLVKRSDIAFSFVVPRSDSTDETLKGYCDKFNITYLKGYNINSQEFYKIVSDIGADLFVSMSFNQIFKQKLINLPPLRTINCHAGKLPFYRGRNVLNWVLLNDEKEFGITIHFVDEGIDTGDIVLQKVFPICDDDDYGTLLEIAYNQCGILLDDAITQIINKNFEAIPQGSIHPTGFYCGGRVNGDEYLDWNQNSRDIFNFVRALTYPGPCAISWINGNEIKIVKVKEIKSVPVYKGIPGQILGINNGNPIVKTKDTIIEITIYEGKYKIRVGDRFKLKIN